MELISLNEVIKTSNRFGGRQPKDLVKNIKLINNNYVGKGGIKRIEVLSTTKDSNGNWDYYVDSEQLHDSFDKYLKHKLKSQMERRGRKPGTKKK